MTSIMFIAPLLALLGAGAVCAAQRAPAVVRDRHATRASDRQRDHVPTVHEIVVQHGTDAAAAEIVRRQQQIDRRDELGQAHLDERKARAEGAFDDRGREVLEHPHRIARNVVCTAGALALVLLIAVNFQAEVGIIGILLPDVGNLRFVLALAAVVTTLGLGAMLMERLAPSGALPRWQAMPLRDRLGGAVAIGIVFACVLAVFAQLATARSDVVLSDSVDRARAACEIATIDAKDGTAAAAGAKEVACGQAAAADRRYELSRTWDQAVAVLVPVGEAVAAWLTIEALVVFAAYRLARRCGRLDRRGEKQASTRLDRLFDVEEQYVQAGLSAGVPPAEILEAWNRAWVAADPSTPGGPDGPEGPGSPGGPGGDADGGGGRGPDAPSDEGDGPGSNRDTKQGPAGDHEAAAAAA